MSDTSQSSADTNGLPERVLLVGIDFWSLLDFKINKSLATPLLFVPHLVVSFAIKKICVLYGGTSTKVSINFIELGIETPANSG